MLKHFVKTSTCVGRILGEQNVYPAVSYVQQRYHLGNKHWNQKPLFKKLRAQKVIKFKLPDYNENWDDLSEEEIRSKLKEKGIMPVRPWNEAALYMTCTGDIFEPYVPPEGDGKFSALSKEGAKQTLEFIGKKGKSMNAIRKIKTYDESFTTKLFPQTAHEIYIKAHELLAKKDEKIITYVTEKAYPAMMNNIENKQIVWKFVQSLEPCRIVHARCTKIQSDADVYAQVTVRFHTQQILAVYDRFGRLMHGSDHLPKDVLEYIVFERHMAHDHGTWRIHDKIVPSWMPPKEQFKKTYVLPIEKDQPQQADAVEQVVPPTAAPTNTQQPTR